MITPNELRIGNYIFDAEVEPYYFKIEEIKKHIGYELWAVYRQGSIKAKEVEGIPLNDKILEKCCEKQTSVVFRYKARLIVKREEEWYDYGTDVKLEYLHQFQNFIFATTKEELKIEL